MNENKNQEAAALHVEQSAQPVKIDLTVRVYPTKEEGNLLAFASVTLAGCFAVRGIRIMDGEKGKFIAMPDRKDAKGEYRDICFPTTPEMREALNTAVLNEYQRVVDLIASRSGNVRPSVHNTLQNATRAAAERLTPATVPQQHRMNKGVR